MSTSQDSTMSASGPSSEAYPVAIVFAAFSFIVAMLIVPSFIWHAQHRNVGATSVTMLAFIANLMNFCNALLWPNDDFASWYNGVGLCDFEVKLQVVMQTAFPASLFCILRSLAAVLDARQASWNFSAAKKWRIFISDIIICGGLPLLQAVTAYIVQPVRYYLNGIAGCQAAVDDSWLAALLMLAPRFLWTLTCAVYSVLVVLRLIRYRRTVTSMLEQHDTNKSRFIRLYMLCIVCVLGMCPLEIYIDYVSISSGLTGFSWTRTHDPTTYAWNSAIFIRSNGSVLFDRYIWLAGGLVIFFTFGFGRDATSIYRHILTRLGVDSAITRLMSDSRSVGTECQSSVSGTLSSIFGKVKSRNWIGQSSTQSSRSTSSTISIASEDDTSSESRKIPQTCVQEERQHA